VKVRDLMTKTAVSCPAGISLAAAGALMWQHDCGSLPIVDDSGTVIGMITDRDICIAVSTRDVPSSQIMASEVVTRPPSVCSPDDDVRSALRLMAKERIRRLPVVGDKGILTGILSFNDIVLRAEKSNVRKHDISYDDVVLAFQAICRHTPGPLQTVAA
jgi:CBS domain-containing protein